MCNVSAARSTGVLMFSHKVSTLYTDHEGDSRIFYRTVGNVKQKEYIRYCVMMPTADKIGSLLFKENKPGETASIQRITGILLISCLGTP